MRKFLFVGFAIAMAFATPAVAAPWVRSYVISAYEPAWYWGGKADYTKAGMIDPGTDCPGGNTPYLDLAKEIKATPWRTKADKEKVLHPPGVTDPMVIDKIQTVATLYRGFRKDIDVFFNPFSAPDPGQDEVVGKIAEGFNLDDNANTGGFTSPDGERGIDNAYYRSWGCISSFRGPPYHATLSVRTTGVMLEGLFTIVVRVSGNKDPMNDDDATMEVGFSPDHPVKSGTGLVVADYSFRIVKSAEYTKMRATAKNGVYESKPAGELHMPKFGWFLQNQGDADFHQGRLRVTVNKDGSVSGLVGGYRDWRELYAENAFAQTGTRQEQREHENLVGMYYALRRNADGMPDPKTGRNMGISIAYRFKAMPAFVVDPATPIDIHLPPISKNLLARMKMCHDVFFQAVASKVIQPPVIAPSMADLRAGVPLVFGKPPPQTQDMILNAQAAALASAAD